MFDRLLAFALRNRHLVLALTLVLFVAAGWALRQMPVDVFPEFAPPQVAIQTEAPGMSPTDVEARITRPLEAAINGAPDVTTVRSKSTVGLSTLVVSFDPRSDVFRDRQMVSERVQAAQGALPATAHAPTVLPATSAVGWLVKYALVSDTLTPEQLRTLADWEIRPRLLALGGIASVVAEGGAVKQYQVRMDPQRMQAYGIGIDTLRQALVNANASVPGAFVQRGGQELLVGATAKIGSLQDIADTVVAMRGGVPITVGNVAEVGLGDEIKRGDGAFMDRAAVIGTVSKAWGADTLATTRKVEAELTAIGKTLPAGVHLDTQVFRQASFIEASVHNLQWALLQGAMIVLAVLFVFLMNARAAFITFVSMPASFAGGLLAMHALGVGINAMTLGGLAIAIGEVVDNGIVTVENVVRRLREGRAQRPPPDALALVFDAVREVVDSVVYATAIIVLIFLPIFFLGDLAGRIFTPLGVAYIAAVAASLVVAVTLVPALCCVLLVRRGHGLGDARTALDPGRALLPLAHGAQVEPESAFVRWLKAHFARALGLALRHAGWTFGLSALALAGALALLPRFGTQFLPEFKEGNFVIAMTLLPGTSLDESMRVGALVRKDLLRYPQVVSIDQRAGRSELDEDAQPPNFSEFDVRLDFSRDPSMPADVLLARIRADLAQFPGAAFNVGQFIAHRMDEVQSGVRSQVAVKIFGDDLDALRDLGLQAQALVRTVPGVVDVDLEQQVRVPQVSIGIDRDKATGYGLQVGQVAGDVETSLNGTSVGTVAEGPRSFDMVLRLPAAARADVAAIRDLPIDAKAPTDGRALAVPLRLLATVQVTDEPASIGHENAQRVLVLGFNVSGRDLGATIADVQARIGAKLALPAGYHIAYGGQFESQRQANRTLAGFGALALLGAVLLLFQAFGSLRAALLVLFNLPLAMIGGIVALYLAGATMSVAAAVGFITLFGIATRNGIILVGRYRQLQQAGRSLQEAVVQGTQDRLVPVLMTAATAALGLLPLLLGSPVGKELEQPLAQVVLGGLFSATALNLLVVPTAYLHIEHWQQRRHADALPSSPVTEPTQ